MFGRVLNKFFRKETKLDPKSEKSTGSNRASGGGKESEKSKEETSDPHAGKSGGSTADKVKADWQRQAAQALKADASIEELCGIDSKMNREQIREKLAMLYRRHNRAASSLNPKLRDEAEIMLEAIAAATEKYLR